MNDARMEPAGVTLGILSIIGIFKDTIDLFELFHASQNLGRDFVVLLTKLDIEKFALLQWAEQVKLLHHNYDRRLDKPGIQSSVAQILACIFLLLSDASKLTERYGLEVASISNDVTAKGGDAPNMSGPSQGRFVRQFEALQRSIKERDASTSVLAKTRWVIRDKQKFGDLINELAHFTTRLKELVTPLPDEFTASEEIIRQDLEEIHSIKQLQILHEASIQHRDTISTSTRHEIEKRSQSLILRALWFRKIDDRRESIAYPHKQTLQWALEPAHSWDDLSEWLRAGSGIYWVSGKAGSGKSTLMKYLRFCSRTHSLLSQWSGAESCHIADFFFWFLGTSEQNTQQGLLRALLYRILSKQPSLIAQALPGMWIEVWDGNDRLVEPPSLAELRRAFDVVSKSSILEKFCFFIDGIDEYVGDYKEGIAFIQTLTTSSRIKVIASSRPIPDCVAAFKNLPKLQLQDLTKPDITAYVQDVIGSNAYMKRLQKRDPEGSTQILDDLVEKSSGVFLWVVLACRSLLSGFADYDRISELRHRVDGLPPELGDMFQLMLCRVEKRNKEQSARLLRLCYLHEQARNWTKVREMSALGLALMSDYHLDPVPVKILNEEEKRELCEDLDGRLRSRCGGLLEINHHIESAECLCEGGDSGKHDTWIDATVQFMHRTVFEFLGKEKVWDLNRLRITDTFDATAALSLGGLHLAMQSTHSWAPGKSEGQTMAFFSDGITWGSMADKQMSHSRENIFWQMSPFLDSLLSLDLSHSDFRTSSATTLRWIRKAHKHGRNGNFSYATLAIAAEANAVNYVSEHPGLGQPRVGEGREHGDTKEESTYPPLWCYAAGGHPITRPGLHGTENIPLWERRCTANDMVRLLLSTGYNPNDGRHSRMGTWWTMWMKAQVQKIKSFDLGIDEKVSILKTIDSFLSAGANTQVLSLDLGSWVRQGFDGVHQKEETLALLKQCKEQK